MNHPRPIPSALSCSTFCGRPADSTCHLERHARAASSSPTSTSTSSRCDPHRVLHRRRECVALQASGGQVHEQGVHRETRHSLGWGYGVHGCVGRTLAQMEASALLGEIVRQVDSIELAGDYEPWMTTVGHGPIRQPVMLRFA